MRATPTGDKICVPSAVCPWRRWRRANSITSLAVAVIAPAGPRLRGSVQHLRQFLLAVIVDVPEPSPEPDGLFGQGDGLAQLQRLNQAVPQGCIPGATGELLDDPPGDDETGVAVGHRRAGRVQQDRPGAAGGVPGDAVVAAAGVVE